MARDAGEAGFGYLELLFSLAILGFAMTAIVPLYAVAARRGEQALEIGIAASLAQVQAEALRAGDVADLASGQDVIRVGDKDFVRTWSVRRDHPWVGCSSLTVTARASRRGGQSATLAVRIAGTTP